MALATPSSEKEALHSPDYLQRLTREHEPSSPSDIHHRSQSEAGLSTSRASSRRRLVGSIPALFILLVTLGLVALIVGWLLACQYVPAQGGSGFGPAFRNGSFVLYEGRRKSDVAGRKGGTHLRVLTWSSWASHIISDTGSVLMTLVAYRVASQWLQHSHSNLLQTPTPLQYGLLVRLMGSSSPIALGRALSYAATPKRRPRLPRLFKEALFFAVTAWILSKAMLGVDTWLHYVSEAVPFALQVPRRSEGDRGPTPLSQGYPCLAEFEGWALSYPEMMQKGFTALSNQSSTFQFVTLKDAQDTAIIVPQESGDYTYRASTFGIQTACTSLNYQCIQTDGVTMNCAGAGYPLLPHRVGEQLDNADDKSISSSVFGIADSTLGGTQKGAADLPSHGRTSNPASLGIQLRWDSGLISPENNVFVPEDVGSAVDTMPIPKVTLYAGCQVTFLNVTVDHDGGSDTWAIVNSTPSSDDFTSILWLPLLYQFITAKLASNVENNARTEGRDNVMAALNQNIGRLALAATSGYFESIEAEDVKLSINDALLAVYPTLVVPAGMSSKGEEEERSMVTLAQAWLVDPLPLVALAFPGEDGKDSVRSVATSTNEMVPDTSLLPSPSPSSALTLTSHNHNHNHNDDDDLKEHIDEEVPTAMAPFRITPQLWERIHHYAAFPPTGVSLQQMIRFGQNSTPGTLLKGSQFLSEELPIRLAHRVKELDQLPMNLGSMPSINVVKNWYAQSFEELITFPPPPVPIELAEALSESTTVRLPEASPNPSVLPSGINRIHVPMERRYYSVPNIPLASFPPQLHEYNQRFTKTLENIKRRHDPTVTTVAQGVLEWKKSRSKGAPFETPKEIQEWLDRFYMSRIGIRFLIGQ
ncbi:hypothetical protein FRB90_000993, partial [Tulasnella sp. 427]